MFRCECNQDRIWTEEAALADHVRSCHGVDVVVSRHPGAAHWGYCREFICVRTNGHDRRIGNWQDLKAHLRDSHGVRVLELTMTTFLDKTGMHSIFTMPLTKD